MLEDDGFTQERATTSYSFGDIVPFPFTDQSATKRRPAVVISSSSYHRERADLIIMGVTSQTRPAASLGEVQVKDWKSAGLIKPSVIKPSVIKPIITTIEHTLVIRRLGQLQKEAQEALRQAISKIVG